MTCSILLYKGNKPDVCSINMPRRKYTLDLAQMLLFMNNQFFMNQMRIFFIVLNICRIWFYSNLLNNGTERPSTLQCSNIVLHQF